LRLLWSPFFPTLPLRACFAPRSSADLEPGGLFFFLSSHIFPHYVSVDARYFFPPAVSIISVTNRGQVRLFFRCVSLCLGCSAFPVPSGFPPGPRSPLGRVFAFRRCYFVCLFFWSDSFSRCLFEAGIASCHTPLNGPPPRYTSRR